MPNPPPAPKATPTAYDLNDWASPREVKLSPLNRHQIRRSMVFHEAGHAVLGMRAGLICKHTGVRHIIASGQQGWTGNTVWEPSRARFCDIAVACGAGGQAAQLRQLKEDGLLNPLTAHCASADHDRDMVIRILADAGYTIALTDGPAPENGTTWAIVTRAAEEAVHDAWGAISSVAETILASPASTITGDLAARVAGITNPART